MRQIRVGDTFTLFLDGRTNVYKRIDDDPNPRFDCERIRVTHLLCNFEPNMKPYTFGTEQEWFKQRGLIAID